MRHTPPLGVAVALGAAKTLILLAALALALGLVGGATGFGGSADPRPGRPDLAPQLQARSPEVKEAIRRHDCALAGFDAGVEPRSALVRRGGKLRHVSFDHGWAVFTGDRPGELIAVCLDDY